VGISTPFRNWGETFFKRRKKGKRKPPLSLSSLLAEEKGVKTLRRPPNNAQGRISFFLPSEKERNFKGFQHQKKKKRTAAPDTSANYERQTYGKGKEKGEKRRKNPSEEGKGERALISRFSIHPLYRNSRKKDCVPSPSKKRRRPIASSR